MPDFGHTSVGYWEGLAAAGAFRVDLDESRVLKLA
jgi:hypothetical protein